MRYSISVHDGIEIQRMLQTKYFIENKTLMILNLRVLKPKPLKKTTRIKRVKYKNKMLV